MFINIKIIPGIVAVFLLSKVSMASGVFLTETCRGGFPEVMSYVHTLIKEQGYHIFRVQAVDVGLRERGYITQAYRVVFFGKKNEIELIRNEFPELVPYIPLNITLFENDRNVDVTSIEPMSLYNLYKLEKIKPLFERWDRDVSEVFANFKTCSF